jgi:hypothetical protein
MSRVWPAISLPFDPFFESFFSSLKFLEWKPKTPKNDPFWPF